MVTDLPSPAWLRRLSAYIAGRLSVEDTATIRSHLADCPPCRDLARCLAEEARG